MKENDYEQHKAERVGDRSEFPVGYLLSNDPSLCKSILKNEQTSEQKFISIMQTVSSCLQRDCK